ncbi:MAG: FtsX-like permease family protein [Pirellulales bacterium]
MFHRKQFVRRSLWHYRRVHLAVAAGVAAATAVLCGALLVGDSVRGSLRHLVLDRFGRIDEVLIVDRFFRQDLAADWLASAQDTVKSDRASEPVAAARASAVRYAHIEPAILLPGGTVEAGEAHRATQVQLLGIASSFWQLANHGAAPRVHPQGEQIVVNQPLADELGVRKGDRVTVRLPGANQVPADSPLGRKTDRIRSLTELTVVDILPADGLGRFALRSTQQFPLNAYLPLDLMQRAMEQEGQVNALLAVVRPGISPNAEATPVPVQLADLGLQISRVRREYTPPDASTPAVILDYYHLTSDRLLLDENVVRAARSAWQPWSPQPVLTYLANRLEKVTPGEPASTADRRGIPYSMVAALDSHPQLGPLRDAEGAPLPSLGEQEIVLTSWAADDLRAGVGDQVRLTWFEPETTHGVTRETTADFTVRAIVPLPEPSRGYVRQRPPVFEVPPAQTNDPDLTPTVAGITDQESIDKWDPPFPYDPKRMRSQDDQYWSRHRTTPKAYVSLATGQRLWGSRFGSLTSLRVAAGEGISEESLAASLLATLDREQVRLGMEFLPLKYRSLEAARGATPFDALFLSLSFFVIGAALLLVALLFRLGIEQRASEIGLLLSVGWPLRRVARTLLLEGTCVAAVGGLVGVAGGVGYAWLLLVGLKTWWLGAIATPFLELYVTPRSLLLGYVSGAGVSLLVTIWSLRALRHVPLRPLLSGQWSAAVSATSSGRRSRRTISLGLAAGLLFLALAAGAGAPFLAGEARGGAFVGAGICLLAAQLVALEAWFRGPTAGATARVSVCLSLVRLAARNAGRHPSRSTLTIGLVAVACFLIVALSVFRMQPTTAGIGGCELLGESAQPIFVDLNAPAVRADLWGDQQQRLDGLTMYAWRMQRGDDASCNNLYQATQPRVLGVSRTFVDDVDQIAPEARFAWAQTAARTDAERQNPWRLLAGESDHPLAGSSAIPVVLDLNTALYSLHLYGGVGQEFDIHYPAGRTIRFRVVGLLANSVLQGNLLVDEQRFTRLFPEAAGYQFFLGRVRQGNLAEITQLLEARLGDEGLDITDSRTRLAGFLAVQNTYLSTFQSLGALGLLLGTFGLATVQVRSVLERRSELGLLRATGFSARRLIQLVRFEHLVLLLGGLILGSFSALAAVAPHVALGSAPIPWPELGLWLGIVLLVGLAAGTWSLRAVARAPLLGALRGD